MSITLPPLPATPSPSKRGLDKNKLKPIGDTLQLRREMMKTIKHTVQVEPPTLGSTLSAFNVERQNLCRADKRRFKAAAIGVLKTESRFIMPWGDDLFRKFSMETLKKQLPTIYSAIYPKKSATEIEADVDMLMIRIGQRCRDLDNGELRQFLSSCLQDFGLLYRRWQPTEDNDASPETAIRRNEYVRFDNPRPRALASVKAPDSPSKPMAKKRAREDDSGTVTTVAIIKKAKRGIKNLVSKM
ncbi:hypothetical protein F5880DRAFT_1529275 [Lentinula raphanica]|nr:hypothetical protein F5880DRAFT_1529275 [Lentinula raphanica]